MQHIRVCNKNREAADWTAQTWKRPLKKARKHKWEWILDISRMYFNNLSALQWDPVRFVESSHSNTITRTKLYHSITWSTYSGIYTWCESSRGPSHEKPYNLCRNNIIKQRSSDHFIWETSFSSCYNKKVTMNCEPAHGHCAF